MLTTLPVISRLFFYSALAAAVLGAAAPRSRAPAPGAVVQGALVQGALVHPLAALAAAGGAS